MGEMNEVRSLDLSCKAVYWDFILEGLVIQFLLALREVTGEPFGKRPLFFGYSEITTHELYRPKVCLPFIRFVTDVIASSSTAINLYLNSPLLCDIFENGFAHR